MNRREMLAAAAGAVGCAALPAVEASTTTTSYSAPFWQFSDVKEAWLGCCDPMTEECPCGNPTWFRFRLSDGLIVAVGSRTYHGYFMWSLFREQYQGSEFFTDIRHVTDVEQIKFLG